MGKEKASGRYNSIRAIFNRGHSLISFFNSKNNGFSRVLKEKKFSILNSQFSISTGFTLVELLTVIAILAVLILLAIYFLNPYAQLKKARDVERKSDVNEVVKAVNMYYDDHQCFPVPTIIPWGQEWKENNTIYMKKVPNGPTCNTSGCTEFTYIAESACPQWFSVFSTTEGKSIAEDTDCPLASLSSCTPLGFSNESGFCATGGDVNCSYVTTSNLLTPTPVGSGGPTSTTTPTPTSSCSKNFACTPAGSPNAKCNSIAPAGSGTYCESDCRLECPGD